MNLMEGTMRKSTKEYISLGFFRRIGYPDGNSC